MDLLVTLLPAAAALMCLVLAVGAFFCKSRPVVRWTFAVGMVLLGNELLLSHMGSLKLKKAQSIYESKLSSMDPKEFEARLWALDDRLLPPKLTSTDPDSESVGFPKLAPDDVLDLGSLFRRLKEPGWRASDKWLASRLSAEGREVVRDWEKPASDAKSRSQVLVQELNRIIGGPSIAKDLLSAGRLPNHSIPPQPSEPAVGGPEMVEMVLNRLLLEAAYPQELGTRQSDLDHFSSARESAAQLEFARFWILALLPGTWLLFALCYCRGDFREFLRRWRYLTVCILLAPLITLTAIETPFWYGRFSPVLELTRSGGALLIMLMLGFVLVLSNLERTFRSSVGTMRWRIKYTVLGVTVILGTKLFEGSLCLGRMEVSADSVLVQSASALLGCGLIIYSVARAGAAEIDLYPSHTFPRSSITFTLGFVYLLIVGSLVFGSWLSRPGGDLNPLLVFGILLALVAFTILILSDRVRRWTRAFVSRFLRRPFYDYRRIWSSFTEQTASIVDEPAFCAAVARHLSQIFEALSVTIWMVNEERGELQFVASTSLSEDDAHQLTRSLPKLAEIEPALRDQRGPLDMDRSEQAWAQLFQQCNPDQFDKGGRRVCVPLVSGGELIGLAVLGDRVSGVQFSSEDLELLRSIGDQVAAGLRNIRLSQRLVRAKELEAFQTMSAFVVHDLKNTASTLSLMLQNMAVHFDDPQFRAEASRGLGKSVAHLNELIARLGTLRQKLELKLVDGDLNRVVESVLSGLAGDARVTVERELGVLPRVRLDPAQLEKVVTNLVLNAREALETGGQVRVETRRMGRWAVLSVQDNGPGMTPEFVRQSLFKPFKTTKQKGLGIGLFHCKMIVEAHQGRIEVESQTGAGTVFRVLLPLEGTNV